MATDTQRIARINLLLARPQGASMQDLIDDLEVSRSTVVRDLSYLRNNMNAPVAWDRQQRRYFLEKESNYAGPTYMIPGLWLSPAQVYAYLTLNNMVEKIAPNLLGPIIDPLRGTLKEMLGQTKFPMYGLHEKIQITMPPMPDLDDRSFGELIESLLHDEPILVETKSGETFSGMPTQLQITANRWVLRLTDSVSGSQHEMNVADLLDVSRQPAE